MHVRSYVTVYSTVHFNRNTSLINLCVLCNLLTVNNVRQSHNLLDFISKRFNQNCIRIHFLSDWKRRPQVMEWGLTRLKRAGVSQTEIYQRNEFLSGLYVF